MENIDPTYERKHLPTKKVKKSNGDGYFHIFKFETDKKFIPRLDIEHTKWGYFSYDKLPTPLDEKLENILKEF